MTDGPGRTSGERTTIHTVVDPPRALAPEDLAPPTLLRRTRLGLAAVGAGLVGTLVTHGVVVGAVVAATALARAHAVEAAREAAEAPRPSELAVVEAKFVKLGRERDPRRLPNRRVPQASTAPPEVAQGAGRAQAEAPPPRDAGPPPPDAVEDLLTRLGTRAEALAKLSDRAYDQEGDPEGVAGGTEERGEGDIYPGRLRNFFRRGFVAPTHIPDDALRDLRALVRIDITPEGRLGAWTLVRGSGDQAYDEAVQMRLRQAEGAQLPEPPADEAARFLGHSTNISFVGRN